MYLSTYQAELDMNVRVKEAVSKAGQRRLLAGRQEPNWTRLQSLGEQYDELVASVKAWFAGAPQPSQQCC